MEINKKNILFLNHAHLGDLFVSRSFVKDICKILPENKYCYAHTHNKNYLFVDLAINECHIHEGFGNPDYIFNTWYATNNEKYYKNTGCTIQTLYKLFEDVYRELNIELKSIDMYIPEIDYSFYNLENKPRQNNSVLICNNIPKSGQSSSFDMTFLIEDLANCFPDKNFYITNDTSKELNLKNVFYTKNILKNNNLIELSWFSTQCSSVIGRSSGPYTFTLTKKNLTEGLKYFEIIYFDNDVGFNNANFGLHKLNYNNFYNICPKNNLNQIFSFITDNHVNL